MLPGGLPPALHRTAGALQGGLTDPNTPPSPPPPPQLARLPFPSLTPPLPPTHTHPPQLARLPQLRSLDLQQSVAGGLPY